MEREETTSAILERVNDDLVICRYKRGARVDAIAVTENLHARLRFRGREPFAVIGVLPADVDFDRTLLKQNYYADMVFNDVTQVLAIVAEGALFESVSKLFFEKNPTSFYSSIFAREHDALTWINERIRLRKGRTSPFHSAAPGAQPRLHP